MTNQEENQAVYNEDLENSQAQDVLSSIQDLDVEPVIVVTGSCAATEENDSTPLV